MPRKPKENYHQDRGRPHAGLTNPAKFGLTYKEVVKLIEDGNWTKFYHTWWRNQKKGVMCSSCRQKKPMGVRLGRIILCQDCKNFLESVEP